MKRYNELSHEEAIALDESGIKKLIELEIAHEGIIPCDPPELLPIEKLEIVPTDIAYEVKGVTFRKQEDALTVLGMETLDKTYLPNMGYDYQVFNPTSDYYGVKEVKCYRKEELYGIHEKLAAIATAKQKNERASKEWTKYQTDTKSIIEAVRRFIDDCVCHQNDLEKAARVYAKYMTIAEDNESIAEKFFRDAYTKQYDETEVNEFLEFSRKWIKETP